MSNPIPNSDPPLQLERALLQQASFLRQLALSLTRDPAVAEDATQETLLAALRQRPLVGGGFRSWLSTVLRRRILRAQRTDFRRERREGAVARQEAYDVIAEERQHMAKQLMDAVVSLPEPFRSTVFARYFDGLSAVEIAAKEGIPAATVRSRLARAMTRLRENLLSGFSEGDLERRLSLIALGLPTAFVRLGATVAATTPFTILGVPLLMKKLALVIGFLVAAAGCVYFFQNKIDTTPDVVRSGSVPLEAPPVAAVPESEAGLGAGGSTPSKITARPFVPSEAPTDRRSASARPRIEVIGRVVDEDGLPVAGVPVTLEVAGRVLLKDPSEPVEQDIQVRRTSTSNDGHFRFGEIPAAATVIAIARPRSLCDAVAEGNAEAGGPLDLGDLVARRGGRVSGHVTDHNGAPVAGATITLRGNAPDGFRWPDGRGSHGDDAFDREGRTGLDGSYRLEGVSPGEFLVILSASSDGTEGFPNRQRSGVVVRRLEETGDIDFQLESRGELVGSVRHEDRLIAGASVSLEVANPDFEQASVTYRSLRLTTGHQGQFRFSGLDRALKYRVHVRATGFRDTWVSPVVTGPEPVIVTLSPSFSIGGLVRSSGGGVGIPDPEITVRTTDPFGSATLEGRATLVTGPAAALAMGMPTDTPGAFLIEDVPSAVVITASAEGHAPRTTDPLEGVGRVTVTLDLPLEAVVEGVVFDPAGLPIAGAVLASRPHREPEDDAKTLRIVRRRATTQSESDDRAETLSDESGRFRIRGLAPGDYDVLALHPEYLMGTARAIVLAGQTVSDLRLQLIASASLVGTAHGQNGQPLARARVTVRHPDQFSVAEGVSRYQHAVTNDRGEFSFTGLSAGTWFVRVEDPESTLQTVSIHNGEAGNDETKVELVAGETTAIRLTLASKASLTVSVSAASGAVNAIPIELSLNGEQRTFTHQGATDAMGLMTFKDLDPGTYEVNVRPPSAGRVLTRTITLVSGASPTEIFRLAEGVVAGRVVDRATGEGIPGMKVVLSSMDEPVKRRRMSVGVTISSTGAQTVSIAAEGAPEPVVTDATGRFRLERVDPGNYRVTASGLGFVPINHDDVLVLAGEWSGNVTLTANRGAELTLKAAGLGSTPVILIGSTTPENDPEAREVRASTGGAPVVIDGLAPGRYRVSLSAPSEGLEGELLVDVVAGSHGEVTIPLSKK